MSNLYVDDIYAAGMQHYASLMQQLATEARIFHNRGKDILDAVRPLATSKEWEAEVGSAEEQLDEQRDGIVVIADRCWMNAPTQIPVKGEPFFEEYCQVQAAVESANLNLVKNWVEELKDRMDQFRSFISGTIEDLASDIRYDIHYDAPVKETDE